jgi:hypothetical protein
MPASPHDALFKSTFEQPDIARSQLELVLPAAVRAHLDLATLEVQPGSFVDPELQDLHTDLLYAVRTHHGEQAFVYVVFEHQSSFDATMPFRMLRCAAVAAPPRQRRVEGGSGSGLDARRRRWLPARCMLWAVSFNWRCAPRARRPGCVRRPRSWPPWPPLSCATSELARCS